MTAGRVAFAYGTVCALVLAVLALSVATQDRIAVNDGRGYDGAHYHSLAEQFAAGERPTGESRFVRRVGTPYLAALVDSDNLVTAFFVVNACAAVLSSVLLYAWLSRYLASVWLCLVLVLVHATHWLQLVRFTAFYPVLVDAWAQACCFAGLLCVASYADRPRAWKLATIALVGGVGVWFREVVLLIPLALLFVSSPVTDDGSRPPRRRFLRIPPLPLWAPLLVTAISLFVLDGFVVATDTTFSGSTHLIGRALSRDLLAYALGWMVAFGPALAVILSDWRNAADFLRRHPWMLAYLALVAGVGWAGSLESERHALNWAAPIVLLLAGRTFERRAILRRAPALVVLVALQLLVSRVAWVVPQPADEPAGAAPTIVLTAVGAHARYLDLFPAYMARDVAWTQFGQHLLAAAVVLLLMRTRSLAADARALQSAALVATARLRTTARWLWVSARDVPALGIGTVVQVASVPFLIGASGGVLAVFSTHPPEPVPVHIRWTRATSTPQRTALERQWRLDGARWREGSTWAYVLWDTSTDRIRSIVQHANVDDTAHLNRRWFRPELRYDRSRQALLLGLLCGGLGATAMVLRVASRDGRRRRWQSYAPDGLRFDGDRVVMQGEEPGPSTCYPPPETGRRRSTSEALGSDFHADVAGRRDGATERYHRTTADE